MHTQYSMRDIIITQILKIFLYVFCISAENPFFIYAMIPDNYSAPLYCFSSGGKTMKLDFLNTVPYVCRCWNTVCTRTPGQIRAIMSCFWKAAGRSRQGNERIGHAEKERHCTKAGMLECGAFTYRTGEYLSDGLIIC